MCVIITCSYNLYNIYYNVFGNRYAHSMLQWPPPISARASGIQNISVKKKNYNRKPLRGPINENIVKPLTPSVDIFYILYTLGLFFFNE